MSSQIKQYIKVKVKVKAKSLQLHSWLYYASRWSHDKHCLVEKKAGRQIQSRADMQGLILRLLVYLGRRSEAKDYEIQVKRGLTYRLIRGGGFKSGLVN